MLIKILIPCQDRSLDFHALCALYAVTGNRLAIFDVVTVCIACNFTTLKNVIFRSEMFRSAI